MDGFTKFSRDIDFVFCIDMTGSTFHFGRRFAEKLDSICDCAKSTLDECGSEISSFRIRLILFYDYETEGENAILESRFFSIPEEISLAKDFIFNAPCGGGGDLSENGLEALYYAMLSDFVTTPKCRQFIFLFTDSDALPLKARQGFPGYPTDMVDENRFFETWIGARGDINLSLKNRNKRMILFAPAETKYEELSANFERCCFVPIEPSNSLNDIILPDALVELFKMGFSGGGFY